MYIYYTIVSIHLLPDSAMRYARLMLRALMLLIIIDADSLSPATHRASRHFSTFHTQFSHDIFLSHFHLAVAGSFVQTSRLALRSLSSRLFD